MMTVQERISQWVDAHEAELIRDIGRLVAVRSVRGEAEPDAPFGPGPRAALDEALALCSEYGFATEIYGCAVGTADLNDQPSRLDILGHLDVVVEGDGWDTPPYEAVLKGDGCLYGRGTDDDKGPVVMALFAMRCVRELGLPIKHGCRLIMGTERGVRLRGPAPLLLQARPCSEHLHAGHRLSRLQRGKGHVPPPPHPQPGLPGPPCPASRPSRAACASTSSPPTPAPQCSAWTPPRS